jgi:hypothetical protein
MLRIIHVNFIFENCQDFQIKLSSDLPRFLLINQINIQN